MDTKELFNSFLTIVLNDVRLWVCGVTFDNILIYLVLHLVLEQ